MTDLERIIADIEYYCKNPEIAPLHYYGDATARMPKQLMLDAIAQLKAQEPDETRLVRHYSRPNVYADLWLHCEKCGGRVDDRYKPKFCPECGRKVNWE